MSDAVGEDQAVADSNFTDSNVTDSNVTDSNVADSNFPDSNVTSGTPLRDAGARAQAVGAQAAGAAHDLLEEAKAQGASATDKVKERATSAAEQQKESLADKIEDVANAVHRSGEQLQGHQDIMAQLVERGADELGTLALTLRNNDLQGLLGNIGSLARRQPALFAGMAMAAGFALTRIGKLAVAGATRDDLPKLPEVDDGQG